MISYTAGRRLKIAGQWREVGDPVPEAHSWMRVEEWVHTGHLDEVEISEDQFRANLDTYVPPEEHALLLEKAEVTEKRKTPPAKNRPLRLKAPKKD